MKHFLEIQGFPEFFALAGWTCALIMDVVNAVLNQLKQHGKFIETTIGQLNFFKWAIENKVVDFVEQHYDIIEKDMNSRNSTSKRKETIIDNSKTRKKREELSISATKSIKKEKVEIVVQFN